MTARSLLLLVSFGLAGSTLTESQAPGGRATPAAPAVVLRGGKVIPVSRPPIDNGVVVMQGDRITAVGPAGSVQVPAGARVIDVTGQWVYPGLIDSMTNIGLVEIGLGPPNDLAEPSDNILPHLRVADAFHAESEVIPVARLNGITHAIVAPASSNSLPGQAALVQLAGTHARDMLLVPDIALPLNFDGGQRRPAREGGARFPSTRMGVMAQLRQAFLDAKEYAQRVGDAERRAAEWDRAQPAERKGDRPMPPKRDLKLEALLPYLRGEKPVVIGCNESRDLEVALGLAREFGLRVILNGLPRAQRSYDAIAAAGLPVILSAYYTSPGPNERYDVVFRMPAELHRRGVRIAFATDSAPHNVGRLPHAAGHAVAYGLPWEAAMRALTLSPAEIWGVADRLGSLEPGKLATVVVSSGDPLEVRSEVTRVFIAGREIPMESRQTRLRDQYRAR